MRLICLKRHSLDFMRIPARLPFLVINLQPDMKSDVMTTPAHAFLPRTEDLMEEFLEASARSGNSARESYLLRETMHSLVRLLKSEQMLEVRQSVRKLVPESFCAKHIQRNKSRRSLASAHPNQAPLLFGRTD